MLQVQQQQLALLALLLQLRGNRVELGLALGLSLRCGFEFGLQPRSLAVGNLDTRLCFTRLRCSGLPRGGEVARRTDQPAFSVRRPDLQRFYVLGGRMQSLLQSHPIVGGKLQKRCLGLGSFTRLNELHS